MKQRKAFKAWLGVALQQQALSKEQIKMVSRAVKTGKGSPQAYALVDWVNLCNLPSEVAQELFGVQ